MMSIDCEDYISSSDSNLTYPNCVEYARITFGNRNSYSMKTERITIGRNSTDGIVDIDVGPQTFVSRKHLEVSYAFQKLNVKCLGKNGIFIDNYFKAHSHLAYELPQECTLRFPSTDVEVTVQQLAGRVVEENRDIEQCKDSVNRGCLKMCVDTEDESTEVDVYLSQANEIENPVDLNYNRGQEAATTQNDMDIYSKCVQKRSVNSADMMDPCTLRVHNVDKRSVMPQIIINPRSYRSYSCSSDFIYGQNGQIFGTSIDAKDLAIDYGTETQKPPYSYAQLIVQAVSTCPDRQLTLNGIYNYISKHYPYFKSHDKGWQNSVRHNLSLNRYFLKVPRAQDEPGKGSFWRIDAAYEGKLITQAFRKRRLRNNACVMSSDTLMGNQGPRVVTMAGARATSTNLYSFSDRSTKLSTFYAVKRTADHKTAFVVKKVNDVSTVSQKLISVVNNNNNSGHSYNIDNKKISVITPNNVFHSISQTSVKPVHKRFVHPSLSSSSHQHNNTNNHTYFSSSSSSSMASHGNTLFNIDGNLYSASNNSELKSIQVISSRATDDSALSLVPVVTTVTTKKQSHNKYILISTSRTHHNSSESSPPSVCITGSGSLYRSSLPSTTNSSNHTAIAQHTATHKRPLSPSACDSDISPIVVAPHSDSSSSDLALQQYPSMKYSQSMDLDFETDQFLVSSPILDHTGDLDTSPDLFTISSDDHHCHRHRHHSCGDGDCDNNDVDDDDDAMWHDSMCFHDV